MRRIGVAFLLGCLLFLHGCGVDLPVEERATLKINRTEVHMRIGERAYLFATLIDADVEPYLEWRTSDEEIVEVYDGILLAVGVGTAYVSVHSRENTASCKVVVEK